jgi:signal transduction histidine kinase/ActR/RegA family two-component response regulator
MPLLPTTDRCSREETPLPHDLPRDIGIVTLDEEGRFTHSDGWLEGRLGLEPGTLLGIRLADLTAAPTRAVIDVAFRAGMPRPEVLPRVLVLAGREGAWRAELAWMGGTDPDGARLVALLREAPSDTDAPPAELSARASLIERLSSGLAHEINNPLAIVVGRLELARRAAGDGPADSLAGELHRSVGAALTASTRLVDVAHALRFLADASSLASRDTELRAAARGAALIAGEEVRWSGAHLTLDLAPAGIVRCDAALLSQLLASMMAAAAKACTGAGGRVVVATSGVGQVRISATPARGDVGLAAAWQTTVAALDASLRIEEDSSEWALTLALPAVLPTPPAAPSHFKGARRTSGRIGARAPRPEAGAASPAAAGTTDPTADFKRIFESCPGVYIVLGPDLRIVAASDAYCAATMTQRQGLLGRLVLEVFPDDPDDPASVGVRNLTASLDRVRRDLVADAMPVQRYAIRRPADQGGGFEDRHWSLLNSPVLGSDGRLAYIINSAEDVTEFVRLREHGDLQARTAQDLESQSGKMAAEIILRGEQVANTSRDLKEANAEVSRLYQRTKELDQLKSQLFANVSHELRTPLALILAPAERMLTRRNLAEADRAHLEVIRRNARLLQRHVDDLLDLATIEAKRMNLDWGRADLAALVRRVAVSFEALAMQRNLSLRVEADRACDGEFDVEKLQRVLLNLVSNAFKFTPAGGAVRISLHDEGDRVVLEVADSGPGIPRDDREVVFERFRQLDSGAERQFGGTGLGLPIAHEIVALHGGSIAVGEAREGGASFLVTLPKAAPPGTRVAPAAATRRIPPFEGLPAAGPASLREGGDGPLVLVVEDNPDLSRFLCDVLGERYRVASAFDGAEGLRMALDLHPDLILTDLMMPKTSGEGLVRALRAHAEMARTPILILSAKTEDALREELLHHGAQDWLGKPFRTGELLARVANLLEAWSGTQPGTS